MQNNSHTPLFLLTILLLLLPLLTMNPVAATADEQLLLFYSNDVRGELEACG